MKKRHLGQAFGMEWEYMVVDRETLNVQPIVDQLIQSELGYIANEIEDRDIGWSNELALHVVELKNLDPEFPFAQFLPAVSNEIQKINQRLALHWNAQLLPTGMHPWMNPLNESRLWPHGRQEIYNQYNKVFGCSGHGWTNLQSVHLNFSFATDKEFRKLHRALRLICPLVPALAASSPFWEGKRGQELDTRLYVYLNNQRKVPEIAGDIIPDDIISPQEYQEKILHPMYRAIAPLDPQGILQQEWLNSRAVIPKFTYGCLEMRLMDVQECPRQDLALAGFFRALVDLLLSERWSSEEEQGLVNTQNLKQLLGEASREGMNAIFASSEWLKQWGLNKTQISAQELVKYLSDAVFQSSSSIPSCALFLDPIYSASLNLILHQGSLAQRMLKRLGNDFSHPQLLKLFREIGECLQLGQPLK